MTATVLISQIIGPTRTMKLNGVTSFEMYGVRNINMGFIQTIVVNPGVNPILDQLTLDPQGLKLPVARPWYDAASKTVTPNQKAFARTNNSKVAAQSRFVGEGSPPPTTAQGYQNVVLAMSDTPEFNLSNGQNTFDWDLTDYVAVSVTGAGQGPLNPNAVTFWSEASGGWSLNISGTFHFVTVAPDGTTRLGTWNPTASQVALKSQLTVNTSPKPIEIPQGQSFNSRVQ
jgi:hypothetical protein